MANLITKDKVLDVAAKFIEVAGDVKDISAIEHVQTQIAQYRLGLFRIVVVGEVKKGKSSFINALLGEPNLLPTASDVSTSTVYKLMYGTPKKIKVFPLATETEKTKSPPGSIEITDTQLKEYGTEDGNPNNRKRVDFIGIQLPHPLLKDGVAIIDTPGLGGLFRKHRDITWRYIPNADAVFFIFDSVEAVASKAEMEYLAKLRELSPLIFFVQTKTDLVEESQWKKWQERNLQIISEQLKVPADKLIYFPVSAKLKFVADAKHSPKHLDRSGYSALLYFLYNKLLAKKEDQLGRRLLSALEIEAAGIHRKLSDNIQIAATETKEGLDSLEKEFIESRTKFEQWKVGEFQRAVTTFQDEVAKLRRKIRDAFSEQLDPSPYSPLVADIVKNLRGINLNPEEANEKADFVLSDCVDRCSHIVMEVQGQYNDNIHLIVKELSRTIGKTLPVQAHTPTSGVSPMHVGSLNMQFNDRSLTTVQRSLTYGAVALTAVRLVGWMFPPVWAAAEVASAVGLAVGLYRGNIDYQARKREEAIAKLQNVLSDAVRKAQSQALRQFETISSEYERGIRDSLQKAAVETEKELADKVRAIAEQRQRSRSDAKQKTDALRQMLQRTDTVLQALARLNAPVPETP